MKIPYEWLKEFVDLDGDIYRAAEELSMSGTEVSSVENGVLEIDILPNRGDCLSVIGVARELGAIRNKQLKVPVVTVKETAEDIKDIASVEIKAPDMCPRYSARVIKGITIKPSPEWMQKRLAAAGMRPINNIVDVTNYVMLETGQPLHAFDLEHLKNKKIIVRSAAAKEKITTIDAVERVFDSDNLVIADAERPVAIAGVMGGSNSEVSDSTKDILLESAYFDPFSINRTSKKFKLRSEASVRFERGIDFGGVDKALDRAISLMAELSDGSVAKGSIDIIPVARKPKKITLKVEKIKKVLGIDIPKEKAVSILKSLGFAVSELKSSLSVTVPMFRAFDINFEPDLIEEIARIYGYDKLLETFPQIKLDYTRSDNILRVLTKEEQLREILVSSGFHEAKTYSMEGEKLINKAGQSVDSSVPVSNPLVEEMTHLRTSVITGLLEAAQYNQNRQIHDIALFEIGKVFSPSEKGVNEKNVVGALLSGSVFTGVIEKDKVNEDFYFMKGIVENIFDMYGACCMEFVLSADTKLPAETGAEIFSQGEKVGFVGLISSAIQENFGIKKPIYVFQLNLDLLNRFEPIRNKHVPLPKYPSVRRDIAMYVSPDIRHEDIVERILSEGGKFVEDVILFDRYRGKDKLSLAYSVIYRDKTKTLTDDEVNFVHGSVLQSLQNNLKIELRE